MTREEAILILKRDNPNRIAIRSGFEDLYDKRNEAFSMAIEALKQEPKTGHWIKHDLEHSVYYDCSRCSCFAPYIEVADARLWKLSNFCPDCGTKMENGEVMVEVSYCGGYYK